MVWRYALVVVLLMQAGLLVSRAVVGSALSDVAFGDALVNNAVASLIWVAPLTLVTTAVNLFAFVGVFRLLAHSEPHSAWWKGAVAALLTALVIVTLDLTWEALSISFANVTFYGDRTSPIIAEWMGHAAFIGWSFLAGGGLIRLAQGRASAPHSGRPTTIMSK
jgi:hypothetical protein